MPNGYVELEDLDALEMEDLEMDESDESDEDIDILERRRRTSRFRQAPRTAPGGGLFRPRPPAGSAQYVTQTQLQAALQRVGAQIKVNSDAIRTINGRVATLSTDVTKQAADLKKETADRRKESARARADLKKVSDAAMLGPLLTRPPKPNVIELSADLTVGTSVIATKGTKLVVNPTEPSMLTTLLPILLMGGLGGSGEGGGGSSDMLLIALAASGGL